MQALSALLTPAVIIRYGCPRPPRRFRRPDQAHDSLPLLLITFARRALAFPLYRTWGLYAACVQDAAAVLRGGRRVVLRCLLGLRDLYARDECRYIMNDLFLTDYCVWIQHTA